MRLHLTEANLLDLDAFVNGQPTPTEWGECWI